MEHRLVGISSPAFSIGGVSTEHVIVGQEVLVAEILGGLSVVSDHFRVGTNLTLWESHTYLHTQPPFRTIPQGYTHKGAIHPARVTSMRTTPCEPSTFQALEMCMQLTHLYVIELFNVIT